MSLAPPSHSRSPLVCFAYLAIVSETSTIVVEISVPPLTAVARARAVTRWLLGSGILVVNSNRDELMQPSEFLAGPQAQTITLGGQPIGKLSNNGVDVVTERTVYTASGNYEVPSCPFLHHTN